MHRDRFRIGALLVAGALLMTSAGCGDPNEAFADPPGLTGGWSTAGCEFARVPTTVTVGGQTMPATPVKLDSVITILEEAGRGEHADSYAGLEVDQEAVRAIVYRVPSAAFDKYIRQHAEDTCVVVRDAAHSANDLAIWHDRLLADLPFWTHRGIRIVTLNARHDGVGLEVGTRDMDRARLELPARYGARAPLVFVASGPVNPLTTAPRPPAAPPGG
jgi:hypothetical protein